MYDKNEHVRINGKDSVCVWKTTNADVLFGKVVVFMNKSELI